MIEKHQLNRVISTFYLRARPESEGVARWCVRGIAASRLTSVRKEVHAVTSSGPLLTVVTSSRVVFWIIMTSSDRPESSVTSSPYLIKLFFDPFFKYWPNLYLPADLDAILQRSSVTSSDHLFTNCDVIVDGCDVIGLSNSSFTGRFRWNFVCEFLVD